MTPQITSRGGEIQLYLTSHFCARVGNFTEIFFRKCQIAALCPAFPPNPPPPSPRRLDIHRCIIESLGKGSIKDRILYQRPDIPGGGGGGSLRKIGWDVRPASQNPYPICDQTLRYSLPYLGPEQKFKTQFITQPSHQNPVSDLHYNIP